MDERDYEDEDGKGISFEDFKAQVKAEVRDDFEKMLDEAGVAGRVATILAAEGFPNVTLSPRERVVLFSVEIVDTGEVERYTLTVDRIN